MKEHDNNFRLLSRSAAAEKLGIGKTTLAKLIEQGTLRVTYINGKIKISVKELTRFLDENTRPLPELEIGLNRDSRFRLKQILPSNKESHKIRGKFNSDLIFNKLKQEVANGIGL